LTQADIAELCVNADSAAHCGRLIETVQLKRLPGLARREGNALVVSLYPVGTTTFTDVDDPVNSRSYSLWDSLDSINAILLYTTQRGHELYGVAADDNRNDLPAEPRLRRTDAWSPRTSCEGLRNEMPHGASQDGLRSRCVRPPNLDRRRRGMEGRRYADDRVYGCRSAK
jgi:hypothetical protein